MSDVDFRTIGGVYSTKAALLAALTGAGNAGKFGLSLEGGILTVASNRGGTVASISNTDATLLSLQEQITAIVAGTLEVAFAPYQAGPHEYEIGDVVGISLMGGFTVFAALVAGVIPVAPGASGYEDYWYEIGSPPYTMSSTFTWFMKNKASA